MNKFNVQQIALFIAFGITTVFFAAYIEQVTLIIIQLSLDPIVNNFDLEVYQLLLKLILSAVIAPSVEEVSKIFPVIVYFRDEDIGENEFLGYSLISALGFSLVENVMYALRGDAGFSLVMLIRFSISTPMHLIATFLTAYFYYRVTFLKKGNGLLIGLGMLVHGIFNGVIVLLSV